jgi:hypothetical protein
MEITPEALVSHLAACLVDELGKPRQLLLMHSVKILNYHRDYREMYSFEEINTFALVRKKKTKIVARNCVNLPMYIYAMILQNC